MNRALAIIREGRDLHICLFEDSHYYESDFDFIDNVKFHFEERISNISDVAKFSLNNYFSNGVDREILDITVTTETRIPRPDLTHKYCEACKGTGMIGDNECKECEGHGRIKL